MFFKILIVLLFISLNSNAQIIPDNIKEQLRQEYYESEYQGQIIELRNNDLIRIKRYGNKYLQITYIKVFDKINIRVYLYYNIKENKLTEALSIRIKI